MSEEWDSWVMFYFQTSLTGLKYKEYIHTIMKDFLLWVDPAMDKHWAQQIALNDNRWNDEGGLEYCTEKGQSMFCKMYYFDETDDQWCKKSVLFRDHYSKWDVKKVWEVSDAFEKFLIERNIKYERENRKRGE